MTDVHRTVITLDVPIEHRFAIGEQIYRQETHVPGPWTPEDERSVWRIIEVGYTLAEGAWYRMAPVNEIARFMAMQAHGKVANRPTPLVDLMGPVTELVRTVDRQCLPEQP